MTALKDYERLESTALWREAEDRPAREVILSLGEATLTISDGSGAPIGHWSLPAIERIDGGEGPPGRFRPGPNAPESLEISDELMIAALDRLRQAIERRRPRPGRLRIWAALLALGGFAALMIFWLPGAMISHTASLVPPAERGQIGARILAAIEGGGARLCTGELGRAALSRLQARLLPDMPGRVEVLQDLGTRAHLPGGIILLPASLLDDDPGPPAFSGALLAEAGRIRQRDPLDALLQRAGLLPALHLLVTGDLGEEVIRGEAARILSLKAPGGDGAPPPAPPPSPAVLSDDEWLSLQQICTR